MWKLALELGQEQNVTGGSGETLVQAIRDGADLRVHTEFVYNEHINVHSDNDELVREVAEFPITYLIDDRWAAGIMSRRQPVLPPESFMPRSSMSFFMYNQNGQQAIARPYLDGRGAQGVFGESSNDTTESMSKYRTLQSWDADTNAPSSNFIYAFERFRFLVNEGWREVLSHDANGEVKSGSLDELRDAFATGCELKVAVNGLCSDFAQGEGLSSALKNELFVHLGAAYDNTERRIFSAGSHPLVRVAANIPMNYASRNWDFGWLFVRSDGYVEYRRCDPYSLQFQDRQSRHALRWFVKN